MTEDACEDEMEAAVLQVMDHEVLDALFESLSRNGYQIIGPTVRDGAIIYDEISRPKELPVGWTDVQSGGSYRLKKREDRAFFGYVVGPQSWKKYLFPPIQKLCQMTYNNQKLSITPASGSVTKQAFVGVRSCEIHAMQIQDKVFTGGPYIDNEYKTRRENTFIVAVNCSLAGGTCFCDSINTGPKATDGFDLALTEIVNAKTHYFTVEIGSPKGQTIFKDVPHRLAKASEIQDAASATKNAVAQMGRQVETASLKELLYQNLEHPRWEEVAHRCLSCANCTMVCPTCFCSTVEDVTSLDGKSAERIRKWDSCFNQEFSYIAGGNIRSSVLSRYRQWMTHKLASWQDQFGTSGCVGCGRCITWCPVGIDLTEEAQAIRQHPNPTAKPPYT